jgi:hypothetical protein
MSCPEKNIVCTSVFGKTMPIVWLGLLLISRLLLFTDNITADVKGKKVPSAYCMYEYISLHTNVLDLKSISVSYVNLIPGTV